MPTYRSYDNKNALPADKYGDVYQFADGTHRNGSGWNHISTVLKNGTPYILKGWWRGSFMWLDDNRIIHIVHGRQGYENKKRLVKNDVLDKKAIGQVSLKEDREVSGRWQDDWECYWHTWDNYPEAYIKFLQFTTTCNFLE